MKVDRIIQIETHDAKSISRQKKYKQNRLKRFKRVYHYCAKKLSIAIRKKNTLEKRSEAKPILNVSFVECIIIQTSALYKEEI